jgi:hypothetical protein
MPQSSVIFFTNKYYPNGKRGDNFRQDFTFQHERGVAFHNENTLFASSINEGGSVHFVSFPNASLADLKDWVAKTFGDSDPVESGYVPGTIYKRIFRPLACSGSFYRAIDQDKFLS